MEAYQTPEVEHEETGGNSSGGPTCYSSWHANWPSNSRALGNATCHKPKRACRPWTEIADYYCESDVGLNMDIMKPSMGLAPTWSK
jgi:hypothetical protein